MQAVGPWSDDSNSKFVSQVLARLTLQQNQGTSHLWIYHARIHQSFAWYSRYYKARTKYVPHKVRPSTASYYKARTKYVPVLLRTTKLAQSTSKIAILPQFLTIEPHFVRKGCGGRYEIAILPQFLTIEPHFVRKGCISWGLVGTAPRLKREIEKKERDEGKRARGQEGKREKMWEDVRRWEDVSRCEDVRRCEKMWADVKMWEDVRRCERCEKMWEAVKMRRSHGPGMRLRQGPVVPVQAYSAYTICHGE